MEDNFQFKQTNTQINPAFQPGTKQKGEGLKRFFNKRNLPKTSAIIIVVGILIIIGAILWGRSSFVNSRVELKIQTSENISSGEETIITINYANNNRVNLNDARLIVSYPQGTFSSDGKEIYQDSKTLGIIAKKTQSEETFKVRFLGEKGSTKNITAKLEYKPANINSRFEAEASSKIEINTVSIGIHVEGSEKSVAGQEVSYAIEYENRTEETVNNLVIKLEYPDDFSFKTSDLAPKSKDETSTWEVGSLNPGEKKTINLSGSLNGQEMENKILRATIGQMKDGNFLKYSLSDFVTQISPAPIVLLASVGGTESDCKVDVGQELKYTVSFKNNTDIALRELILKVYLQDGVFDFREIDLGGKGFFDSRTNTITWSGADILELSLLDTSQSGEVKFFVKVKNELPIYSFNDKNFKAGIVAEIQTLTVPAKFAGTELKFEKELSCKINTQLFLNTKGYYYEPSQGIYNTGPIPPKVNELTNYTIHWQIINVSNDLENVIVKSVLPQGINYMNYYINKLNKGQFSYNDRTKEIIWNIGKVPAGTGKTLPLYELIFQVGITPSINQVGDSPILINQSQIEGKDMFTGNNLNLTSPPVDTSVPDDTRMTNYGKQVVE
ncbi:MAG: hypothetical protein V1686_00135 [Patescibacteria group bacterium]